ncbi:transposable element Tcb1 transposase [Trichonephila clavipes]|nr:transposable element Tcb1 transposase [Trichonephila clavipes]
MSSRHHIDDFMRGRIIGKIEEGRKITGVAREFDIAHSVVSRLWKSFKTTGMCSRRHGGGRVRSTMLAEHRYIVLSAKRNRRTTAQQVANQFLAASGKQISRKTVARRLRGGGLYARTPVVCVPLTRQHRTARLQWCREHHNWTEQDWAYVLFSDESRFSPSSDCRRQLIWRESGTAYHPENIQEKDRYPTCSIMVWAGILINGRTRLHVVANGTMTGHRYIDEVQLPHVRLFRGAVGDKFVFMDDNATCHRTLAVQDCLDSEGIQRLVRPARSLDLNPIENVWDALGGKLLVETILRQTRTPSFGHSQRNGINCLNSCWIMLFKTTASSTATQTHVAPLLGAPVSSRTIGRRLADGRLGSSSYDNRVRLWRPHGERLNSAFDLQRHTAPTAGLIVLGVIAYHTRSPLVLIHGTMTAQCITMAFCNRMCCPSCNGSQEPFFNKTMIDFSRQRCHRAVSALYCSTFAFPIPIFVSNRAYLRSFGRASWAFHEFERGRGNVTANIERNVSRHDTELVCLNARSFRIVHSR